MPKHWTYEACKAKQAYIKSINPVSPGATFNGDPGCFARYCNMQANWIDASGYPLIAQDIRQYRDIADPAFRSKARNIGAIVTGVGAYKMINRTIAVFDADTYEQVYTGSLADFAAANGYDAASLYAELIAAQETSGRNPEPVTVGGGSAPAFDVSLIDER